MNNLYGLWCDDITFCQETCDRMDCPRNQKNIRDRTIPHSYSVEIPTDCLKKKEEGFPEWAKNNNAHVCVTCGRASQNRPDYITMCPIEDHYAVPMDGFCHLWEEVKS